MLPFHKFSFCGQETVKSPVFSVYGKVIETESGEPLQYATIVLKNTITQKITGAITDEYGEFKIQTPKGTYDINVEFISFKTRKFISQEILSNKNLGIIKLEDNGNNLDEIFVTAEKSTIDIRLDKKSIQLGMI